MSKSTPSVDQGTGPLYSFSLIFDGIENAVEPDSDGAVRVAGKILDASGRPVCFPDALIEFLQEDQFARAQTDVDGNYHVVLRKPRALALKDGTRQAPHFDVILFVHPVMTHLRTQMYFPDEISANAKDPILNRVPEAARSALVAKSTGKGLQFDIVLQGPHQTTFFQPKQ
jgi:protocatechuate 3,4-dioxygenase alpha subunit